MKAYCEDEAECRHALLLRYFGETLAGGRCGDKCDNCRRRNGAGEDPDWPKQVELYNASCFMMIQWLTIQTLMGQWSAEEHISEGKARHQGHQAEGTDRRRSRAWHSCQKYVPPQLYVPVAHPVHYYCGELWTLDN